jgi:hypothetical protein
MAQSPPPLHNDATRPRYYDPLATDPTGRRIAIIGDDDGDSSSLSAASVAAAPVVHPGGGGALAPLKAVAMDSGTWPMDGGGVATCR